MVISFLAFKIFWAQIVDPKLASYGVENPIYAVIQLAQTTMRSELGKITLDKTFEERDTLNEKIVVSLVSSTDLVLIFALIEVIVVPTKPFFLFYKGNIIIYLNQVRGRLGY